ncbi:hypothetical protein HYU22_01255 [Candidatus Woesearchaeota archaeon]|nr:hypothetical protein [Candidatus Woesearchaeota archaeon]
MNLTTLVQALWRTPIGRMAAAAAVASGLASCSGKTDSAKDTTPPCVELRMSNFQRRGEYNLDLSAVDSFYSGCSHRIKIREGLEVVDEIEAGSNNDGLKKVELYENGTLVRTFRHLRSYRERVSESIFLTHTEGDFTYHAIAYDMAGNKTESNPIPVSFRDGFSFRGDLAHDTVRPTINGFGYLPYISSFGAIVEDNTGIKEVRLYDRSASTVIQSERPSAGQQSPTTVIYFKVDHPAQPNHRYGLEAEDFFGNVAQSPVLRPFE